MDWGTIITSIVGAITAGGGIGTILTVYYRNKLDRQQQNHVQSKDHQTFINEQNREVIIVLQAELRAVRSRHARLEESHDEIRKELADEYAKDIKLQAEVNRLQEDSARQCNEIRELREQLRALRGKP